MSLQIEARSSAPGSARPVQVVGLAYSAPRLRLEVLTAFQVELVLGITYAAVIAAVLVGVFERQALIYSDVTIAAPYYGPHSDTDCEASARTACLGESATWCQDGREFVNATATPLNISVNYTNSFFKLHANISTRGIGADAAPRFCLEFSPIPDACLLVLRTQTGGSMRPLPCQCSSGATSPPTARPLRATFL